MNTKEIETTTGNGGLRLAKVRTPWSTAEIYLHGAHVTSFQKNGEPPLIFLSEESLFAPGKAIRGGVPVCFPWFGSRAGQPAHGFARLVEWKLIDSKVAADGSVAVRLRLPENAGGDTVFPGKVEYAVTVNDRLTLELQVTNPTAQPLDFEECLHAYFSVGDINDVAITGLKGAAFLDKTDGNARKLESGDAIKIVSETDRVYPDTTGAVEIQDAKWRRIIRVLKSGSASTVVWNPWIEKSRAMADFGDDEFRRMVCVEAGNVGSNRTVLAPGKFSVLKVELGSAPLK